MPTDKITSDIDEGEFNKNVFNHDLQTKASNANVNQSDVFLTVLEKEIPTSDVDPKAHNAELQELYTRFNCISGIEIHSISHSDSDVEIISVMEGNKASMIPSFDIKKVAFDYVIGQSFTTHPPPAFPDSGS